MKKITLTRTVYGSIEVDDTCPNDPDAALEFIDLCDMWDQVEWDHVSPYGEEEVAFIDEVGSAKVFYER